MKWTGLVTQKCWTFGPVCKLSFLPAFLPEEYIVRNSAFIKQKQQQQLGDDMILQSIFIKGIMTHLQALWNMHTPLHSKFKNLTTV